MSRSVMFAVRDHAGRAMWAISAAMASALFAALTLSLFHVDGVPALIPALLVALACLSFWRPPAALLIVAGGVPVAAWVGRWWHEGIAWPEAVVLAFAAGYMAQAIRSRRAADGLTLSIAVLATVVVASLGVQLALTHWTMGGEALELQLLELIQGGYFLSSGVHPELDGAMRLLEGLVLLRAAATVVESRPSSEDLVTRWIAAAAALAGALTLWRLWQGALRTEAPAAQFVEYLATLRYNVHYGDVNAAGSYYVMTLFLALGLVIAARKGMWIAATLLIAAALMLSGSRAAFLAGVLAAGGWTAYAVLGRSGRRRIRPVLGWTILLIVLTTTGAGYYIAAGRNLTPASSALSIRAGFVKTTARMIQDYPAFGVGVGQYARQSGNYSPPGLLEQFGTLGENAHNNFLQLLGELGIVGAAAFLGVLGVAGRRIVARVHAQSGPLSHATIAGLAAFVMTWLSGHPLLIDEPAMSFWLLLGSAAGGRSVAPAWSGMGALAAGVILLLLISVPLRVPAHMAGAALEHHGIGLSAWQQSEGVRYRVAGPVSTVFVPPADAVTIPIRSAQPGRELVVSVMLNDRKVNEVRVGDDWYFMRLLLPRQQSAPQRFFRVQLLLEEAGAPAPESLMIGKVEPHY